MPTGYTEAVQSGKIVDLPSFALLCARAFGATIMMRDDPLDAPIPDEFQPSQHSAEWARQARADLAKLDAMSPDEISATRDAAEAERAEAWAFMEARIVEQLARYEAMLAKVLAWTPPTDDHVGLKEFMVQQINESIRFDCAASDYKRKPLPPAREWFVKKRSSVAADLERHEKSQREEEDRTAQRNAWVRGLRESLAKIDGRPTP